MKTLFATSTSTVLYCPLMWKLVLEAIKVSAHVGRGTSELTQAGNIISQTQQLRVEASVQCVK